jgi:hypothetical protein
MIPDPSPGNVLLSGWELSLLTRAAIERAARCVGLPVEARIDEVLLAEIRQKDQVLYDALCRLLSVWQRWYDLISDLDSTRPLSEQQGELLPAAKERAIQAFAAELRKRLC